MHPAVAIAMIVAIALMLRLPRRYAVVPFLAALFLLPAGQELHVGGVHLYVPRIMILFGLGRLVSARVKTTTRILPGGWKDLDKLFTCWAILRAVAVIALNMGSSSALINQTAFLWDTLGGYYLLRFFIRDIGDIVRVAKTFALIVGLLGLIMLNEKFHHQNLFGYLGSGPIVPQAREGNIRAQGPFAHPILAGTFAATLFPFFIWLWQSKKASKLGIMGVAGCTAMVLSSASSTPLLAYMAVLGGICFWPLRRHMRRVRWALLIGLIACQVVMKAPVWFLINHVNLIAGNSGYHRAMLIDTFIRHFSNWWLIGTNQQATWGFEMDDLCQQWVAEGGTGGLATLVLFILLISRAFGKIGNARKRMSKDRKQEWMLWFIGVALFSHFVGFFGISYFDQTRFSWYALLVIISVATGQRMAAAKLPRRLTEELDREPGEMVPAAAIAPLTLQNAIVRRTYS
jgi:hypothetical protein